MVRYCKFIVKIIIALFIQEDVKMDIPTDRYLKHAKTFLPEEKKIQKALLHWIPNKVIDVHAHSNKAEHVQKIIPGIYHHIISTFPHFSIEESQQMTKLFFPGITVRKLRFPTPYIGIAHKQANQYLLENTPHHDKIALCAIPNDIEYTNKMLKSGFFSGLKVYYYYTTPPKSLIYDFCPHEILEQAESTSVPIILHLPKPITQSISDLNRLQNDFPKLIIVLAHMGLAHLPTPELDECYKKAAKSEYTFLDTSMIASKEVLYKAMQIFGTERIMFGSDEPIHMLRCSIYQNPKRGPRLISDYPYHWTDIDEHHKFKHLAGSLIHAIWKSINAIKDAISLLPLSIQDKVKTQIFYSNAQSVYGFEK